MATITIDDAELRELVRRHAQRAAAEYLTNRTIPPFPAYFFEGHWLVTYDWLRNHVAPLESDIATLRDEIAAIRRPWWKRWFSR